MSNTYVVVAELFVPSGVPGTEPEIEYIDSYSVEAEHEQQALAKVAENEPHLTFANVILSVEK